MVVFIWLSVLSLLLGFFPAFLVGWFLGLGMAKLIRWIIKVVKKQTAKGGGAEAK